MFAWMQRLIDAVPQEWSPTLKPAGPDEKVLGKLPGDIWKAFLGSSYAGEEARRLAKIAEQKAEAHRDSHLIDGLPPDEKCKEHHDEYDRGIAEATKLSGQAKILTFAVTEAVREHFGVTGENLVDIREEGVVLIEKTADPLEELFGGLGIEVMTFGPDGPQRADGDEGFFDLGRRRRRGRANEMSSPSGMDIGALAALLSLADGPRRRR